MTRNEPWRRLVRGLAMVLMIGGATIAQANGVLIGGAMFAAALVLAGVGWKEL